MQLLQLKPALYIHAVTVVKLYEYSYNILIWCHCICLYYLTNSSCSDRLWLNDDNLPSLM